MTKTITKLTCTYCGKSWWPRTTKRPKVCPRCKSPRYDKPRIYVYEDGKRQPGRNEPF